MRVATIDCGTNTLLLLVAESDPLEVLEDREAIVRLGEGLDASGELKPEAIRRALAVFRGYVDRIAELECAHVIAAGTEALRRAQNGHLFVNEATALLGRVGGRMFVIDGKREAALCWRATAGSFPDLNGPRTVIDIGGGSTEILVGDSQVDFATSLAIGSVRLTERCVKSDPPAPDERAAILAAIDDAIAGLPPLPSQLVGIAGTVTNLAAMAGVGVGAWLPATEVRRLTEALGNMTVAERRACSGLDERRADVIYAGALILERVMMRANATRCLVSDRGVRWGLFYEAIGR